MHNPSFPLPHSKDGFNTYLIDKQTQWLDLKAIYRHLREDDWLEKGEKKKQKTNKKPH